MFSVNPIKFEILNFSITSLLSFFDIAIDIAIATHYWVRNIHISP